MASTFSGLTVAFSGLQASNTSINVTANNIANINTEGYSRQSAEQKAAAAIRNFQKSGCIGAGAMTSSINRTREEFYDEKYRENQSYLGEYNAKSYYMKNIETFFDETTNSAGFTKIFDDLISNSLQEVMKNPSSDSAKRQFIGDAGSLVDYFNSVSGRLQNTQADLNSEVKLTVDTINSYASQIATLNKQINVVAIQGGNTNQLKDERDLIVDKLAELVDVDTLETDIGSNMTRYIIRIAGGITLVDDGNSNELGCVTREDYEKVNQSDIDGLYNIEWTKEGTKFNLGSSSIGGKLQALLALRDGNNRENFNGTITKVGEEGGKDFAVIEVKNENLMDLNKSTLPDSGIINLGDQDFYFESWEYTVTTDDDGNSTCSYKFILDSEKNTSRIVNSKVGKGASVGDSINYMGIPYYMSQMNEWVRTFSEKVNDVLKSGYTSDGKSGVNLFTGAYATDTLQYKLDDNEYYKYEPGTTVTVKSSDDSYRRVIASNFSISKELEEAPGDLATKSVQSDGVEQGDLLKQIQSIAKDKNSMSFRGSSAHEFLECVLADTALNTYNSTSFASTYEALELSINNQRMSISGVDNDEEALNLVKFQNAYNLSAKVINILSEMYNRLILETGV